MREKPAQTTTTLIIVGLIAIVIAALLVLSLGCTLRFEAEKLKLDADPIEGKIGTIEKINTTYKLVALDILKDVNPPKTGTQ